MSATDMADHFIRTSGRSWGPGRGRRGRCEFYRMRRLPFGPGSTSRSIGSCVRRPRCEIYRRSQLRPPAGWLCSRSSARSAGASARPVLNYDGQTVEYTRADLVEWAKGAGTGARCRPSTGAASCRGNSVGRQVGHVPGHDRGAARTTTPGRLRDVAAHRSGSDPQAQR